MKVTIRHYNETVDSVIYKLTKQNNQILDTLIYNATAYLIQQYLFELGKLEVAYINKKDFIPMTVSATKELLKGILSTNNMVVASLTLDIAEFCTELHEKLFKEVDFWYLLLFYTCRIFNKIANFCWHLSVNVIQYSCDKVIVSFWVGA